MTDATTRVRARPRARDTTLTSNDQSTAPASWGRVDETTGAVFVRIGDTERQVGEYPDASAEEALGYYIRKFTELEGTVTLLEQRARGGAPAADVAKASKNLLGLIEKANAVGDLASLTARVEALGGVIAGKVEEQSEAHKAEIEAAVAERTAIAEAAEEIAARDLTKVQWTSVGAEMDALFKRWQEHQASGPRLPKSTADALWKRFSAARSTVDAARRAFFHQIDSAHKDARGAKEALIAKAEALGPKGSDGIPAYRLLVEEWKQAGRAGKKSQDDALWDRFKAAGDALYAAKKEQIAAEHTEFSANLETKLALLAEAEGILRVTDRKQARELLSDVQRRWEKAGKVPREQVKPVEDRLRKVEAHVRKLDEDHWHRTDPSRVERYEGFAGQLQDSIAKLENELAAAEQSGDKRKIEDAKKALDTQKAWLAAVKQG
ncbi:MAG: DUF349 domain-containing protein [Microbacteriaceae bacterium]|nr:DUF349 domain-containing protein [Microbacteriaceae bacterium]